MHKNRITFTGDIMCEKPLLKAKKSKGDLNFDSVFSALSNEFSKSDEVIGNLETVFAGKENKFTDELFSFNTPDSFLESMHRNGITMVTTANNHILDRGIEGLNITIDKLEQLGIKNVGTYKSNRRPFETILLDGLKIGIVAYTYGTNTADNGIILNSEDEFRVNMLKNQSKELENFKKTLKSNTFRGKVSKIIRKFTTFEQRYTFKKRLGMSVSRIYQDHLDKSDVYKPYMDQLQNDIDQAKKQNDIVIVLLHSGGQFNREVGSYTKHIVELISGYGVDIIVGHHPHVIQKYEKVNDTYVFYSLGNYSISPSSVYLPDKNLPEYGILLHLIIDSAQDYSFTFSIIKMIEDTKGDLSVINVSELSKNLNDQEYENLKKDVLDCYNTFLNKQEQNLDIESMYNIR